MNGVILLPAPGTSSLPAPGDADRDLPAPDAADAAAGRSDLQVLVAIDGSPGADLAVDLVAGSDWPEGSTISVVQAVDAVTAFGGPWPSATMLAVDDVRTSLRREAERTVRAAAARLERDGLTVAADVLDGRPATAVADRAASMPADLIVVGSCGHGAIESMLLGSVSAELVDRAHAPVLVARGTGLGRVVLGWDGSACAEHAADIVRAWPIFADATIRVVSVADVDPPWWTGVPEPGAVALLPIYDEAADASREHHDRLADEMTERLRGAGLAAESDRREGDTATELIAAARTPPADLIVVGSHGHTGLTGLLLGSVARNVLQHAPCSVLVVREDAG